MEQKNITQKIAELPAVEWSNERVMTTAQLAEFYETSTDNLRVNFSYAQKKDRFVEGKHFFKLEGDELEKLRAEPFRVQISPMTRVLYLWTKRGAARHAKMLNTDKAWEVFEALEDNYFDRSAPAKNDPLSEFDAVKQKKDDVSPIAILAKAFSEHVATEREKIAVEREKLALEREKFNVDNSDYKKNLEIAKLLRELASASGDESYVRGDLVRASAKLIMGEDFFKNDPRNWKTL